MNTFGEEFTDYDSGIRVLESFEEKQCTRSLYEEVFSDSKDYVDYYYQEKCKDNRIFVKEDHGTILSMVHLNPYTMMICGKEVKIYCIAAVATIPEYRHRGFMRENLEGAFDWMEQEGIPFCYLIPVDEKIYQGMGFESICPLVTEEQPKDRICREYEIYPKRDAVYEFRKEQEKKLVTVGDGDLPEHPVIMARVINQKAFDVLAGTRMVFGADGIDGCGDKLSIQEETGEGNREELFVKEETGKGNRQELSVKEETGEGNREELSIQEVTTEKNGADQYGLEWLRERKIYICDEV